MRAFERRKFIDSHEIGHEWVNTTTKCGCSSLIPIHQTSEFTRNPVKSVGIHKTPFVVVKGDRMQRKYALTKSMKDSVVKWWTKEIQISP